jgi:nicotinamide mononucleotide transporter
MTEFLQAYWLDITTTILGLAYIILEYKASIWLWLVGFVMQVLGIILYYQKGLYADCGMEFYYLSMTVYGFALWTRKTTKLEKLENVENLEAPEQKNAKPITHFERRFILPWTIGTLAIWFALWWFLVNFTDSRVPIADSFTTALSFVGIWALARKYLEQWLIWIVVDIVTCVLYFYKDIPFKASLYALYVIIAIAGYYKWKKQVVKN